LFVGATRNNAPPDYKFKDFISGQKRGVTPSIMREFCAAAPLSSPLSAISKPITA